MYPHIDFPVVILFATGSQWCGWVAVYCSCISFANTKYNDDTKQIMSSFMLSISAVVMSYLQNPMPMTLPFSG